MSEQVTIKELKDLWKQSKTPNNKNIFPHSVTSWTGRA